MTVLQRQRQLMQQISKVNDEDILMMLKQELSYRLQCKPDITDKLTPFELNELITLANDTSDKNTVSLIEYRKATERWRYEFR